MVSSMQRQPEFALLDGIRGLAAFVVVLNHARGVLFVGGQAYLADNASWLDKLLIAVFQVTSLGPHAVIVFFVLSGFSIAHSVERGGTVGEFYSRRLLRLLPPCLGGMLLAWLPYSIGNMPYGKYITQYWSLVHEAIFYFLAPFIAAPRGRWYFLAVACAGFVAGLQYPPDGSAPWHFLFHYALYFAVGVVAYHRRDDLQRIAVSKTTFVLACAVLVAGIVGLTRFWLQGSFLASAALSLFLICNFQQHRITNAALRGLGAMSYTLYVTHFAAIWIWAQWLGFMVPSSNPWQWMTAVPFCLAVSVVFYLALELPSMRALKYLRRGRAAWARRAAETDG